MKIGLNAKYLTHPATALGEFTENLIKTFAQVDQVNEYIIFVPQAINWALPSNFKIEVVPLPKDGLFSKANPEAWENIVLPAKAKALGVDVMHYTYSVFPSNTLGVPSMVTIHDVFPVRYTEEKFGQKDLVNETNLSQHLNLAGAVTTVNLAAKLDIVSIFDFDGQRVSVVHPGVNPYYFKEPDEIQITTVKKRYQISKDFIFYMGGFDVRKNVKILIDSYVQLMDDYDFDLVIGGTITTEKKELQEDFTNIKYLADKIGLKDKVKLIGLAPPEDLTVLYRQSKAFVYPSFFEGFGMPILQAMACGVPIISSLTSGIIEFLGGSQTLIDPFNMHDLTAAIKNILDDPEKRDKMKTAGQERAERFSWEASVNGMLKAYKDTILWYEQHKDYIEGLTNPNKKRQHQKNPDLSSSVSDSK